MAYLPGYSKYKVLTLTGGASGALTNHQLKIAVSYEAAMQGDFDDLRFTQADGTTLVDAWAEVIVTDIAVLRTAVQNIEKDVSETKTLIAEINRTMMNILSGK